MGLRILHSADWHLGSPFSSFSQAQQRLLRRSQEELPFRIAELCRAEKCDLMLLAGDLFDGKPGKDLLAKVKQALGECGVPVFISPGNHDHWGLGDFWREQDWPENVYVFSGGLESVPVPGLNCRIYGAGYRSMDCPGLLEDFRAEGAERYVIGLLHADPLTGNSPCCPVTAAQIRESGLDYLALGHIHKAGMLHCGATLCGWPGCPMGRGWDETGEKGVYLVTLEQQARIRFVPLDVPRFYDLELWQEDLAAPLESLLPPADGGNFLRITLRGENQEDPVCLGDWNAHPNLLLRDRREAPLDLWDLTGEDSLQGLYFRRLRDLAEQDDRALLAARISRKILLGRQVDLP